MTTIYLVRHGESLSNTYYDKGLPAPTFGELGSDLTELGEEQARTVAKKLNHVHFDAVFSSDFIRAKRTAEIIKAERKLEVITTHLIRELNWGDYHNRGPEAKKKIKELQKGLSDVEKMKVKVGDMESQAEAVSRLITFLRETAIAYPEQNILVVAHGNIMRSLLVHLGFAPYNALGSGTVKNGGYIKLESDGIDFFVKETYDVYPTDI